MAVTLGSLQNDVLNRLNEALNSPAGALQSGTGGTPTLATPDTITAYLNEAGADLARGCWPLFATGSAGVPVPTQPGEVVVPFASLAGTGQGNLWAARTAIYGATLLQRVSRKYLDVLMPTLVTDPTAAPLYWYPAGVAGIGIAPRPNAAATLTVNGLALPPALVNAGDTVTWLDADLTRFLAIYATYFVALKNMEDESLSERAGAWWEQYKAGKATMAERVLRTDPSTLSAFYPEAVAMLRGQGK